MIQNRRKYMRINVADTDCVVELGHAESGGVVVDESIEGLRIGDLELLILFKDQKVVVRYHDETIIGRCRSVSRNKIDRFEVGIQRESESYQENARSLLLNSFMRFENINLVCIPLGYVDANKIEVSLIDGKKFVVKSDQVFQMTREERMDELVNQTNLADLRQVYSIADTGNSFGNRQAVLDHEFGTAVPVAAN